MVTEIAGARILTPFFGASLYSWASTLAITLLALMSGYYYGGHLSTKPKFRTSAGIIWLFLISGILVLLMPVLGLAVMKKTISFSFFSGLIISELAFLFPPICLMGMISPLIISQITRDVHLSGRSAGNIYAISTSGGILFTLLFGFLIIPNYGITVPLRILGLSVALLAGLLLLRRGVKKPVIVGSFAGIAFLSIFSFSQNKSTFFPLREGTSLVKTSEGLLGELEITDEAMRDFDGKRFYARRMTTNNILQEHVFADSLTSSLMYYVNFTDQLLNFIPQKTSALLVGLGTGSLYALFRNHQIKTETVELDQRIYNYGVSYFGMQPHSNHTITDGRYYLNKAKKKYDLILLDVIIGESVPIQLISLEAFQRCSQLLNDGGTLVIEHGAVNGFEDNSFVPSVVKTLGEAGFQVSIFNPVRSKSYGDILLVASKTKFKSDGKDIVATKLLKAGPLSDYELPLSCFDTASATVLADDVNNTDILLANHYFRVREWKRDELAKLIP
jgi:spermidine synthase